MILDNVKIQYQTPEPLPQQTKVLLQGESLLKSWVEDVLRRIPNYSLISYWVPLKVLLTNVSTLGPGQDISGIDIVLISLYNPVRATEFGY